MEKQSNGQRLSIICQPELVTIGFSSFLVIFSWLVVEPWGNQLKRDMHDLLSSIQATKRKSRQRGILCMIKE